MGHTIHHYYYFRIAPRPAGPQPRDGLRRGAPWWSPVGRAILTAAPDELRLQRGRTGVRRGGPPIPPREPTRDIPGRRHGRGIRLGGELASFFEGARRARLAQHVLADDVRRPRAADVHEARSD